jgi:hypothetical protein
MLRERAPFATLGQGLRLRKSGITHVSHGLSR